MFTRVHDEKVSLLGCKGLCVRVTAKRCAGELLDAKYCEQKSDSFACV